MNLRPAVPLVLVTLLATLGIIVLAALHVNPPAVLSDLALAALVGGAGVTVPTHTTTIATPAAPAPVPAVEPAP